MGEGCAHGRMLHRGHDLHRACRLALERLDRAAPRPAERMPRHVDKTERHLTHVGIGRKVVLRRNDAPDKVCGYALARLVVLGPEVEILLLRRPILHHLRRQLHKVAADVGTIERLVLPACQHPVQRMSEFVQQRRQLVERKQRGRRGRRPREVHNQRHQRPRLDAVGRAARAAELGHPRPRPLRRTREEVEIQHRKEAPVGIRHLVGLHVGMVDIDTLGAGEMEPVEPLRQQEDATHHILQMQVGFHLLVIHGVVRRLVAFGIVGPVPRHHLRGQPLLARIGRDRLHVAMRP